MPVTLLRRVCVLSLCFPVFALAQPAADVSASSSATSPTTAPAAPAAPVTPPTQPPPGYVKIEHSHSATSQFVIYVLPEDQTWAQDAMRSLTFKPKPSTMPTDLITTLQSIRGDWAKELAADSTLTQEQVDVMLDGKLLPALKSISDLPVNLAFLAAHRRQIVELVKSGYTHPRFQYNRAMDDVLFKQTLLVSESASNIDTLIPSFFEPTDPPATRSAKLVESISTAEAGIQQALAERGLYQLQVQLLSMFGEELVVPLNLGPDQEWLGLGASGVLTAKYSGKVAGVERERIVAGLMMERRDAPVRAGRINVMQPTSPADLRPEYLRPYGEAFRRRSVQVTNELVTRAGYDGLAKVLAAVKAQKPADGPALLKLIQDTTGVDLTETIAVK